MKQYKLTAWPELPPRFQKTTMRRVVSELSQRFVSVRDLARSSGASARDIEELISTLEKDGMLMTRATPVSSQEDSMPRTIMRQCKCALFDSVGYNLRSS